MDSVNKRRRKYNVVLVTSEQAIAFQTANQTYVDRLVRERHKSIANALELRLPCTNQSYVADHIMHMWPNIGQWPLPHWHPQRRMGWWLFMNTAMMIYYHIVYKASLGHNELTSLEDRGKMSWCWWYHAWPCILRGTSPWRPLRGLLSWCSIYLSVRSLRPVDFVKDLPSNLSYKVGASWSALLQLHLHSWLNTWFKWIG